MTTGHGITVGHNTIGLLMRRAALTGLPVRRQAKRVPAAGVRRGSSRPCSSGSVREFISVLLDDKDFEAMARTLTELDQRRVPPVTIEH